MATAKRRKRSKISSKELSATHCENQSYDYHIQGNSWENAVWVLLSSIHEVIFIFNNAYFHLVLHSLIGFPG
jgi:hypothetical protein